MFNRINRLTLLLEYRQHLDCAQADEKHQGHLLPVRFNQHVVVRRWR